MDKKKSNEGFNARQGARLQKYRENKGLSRKEVSELVGMSASYIGMLETGKRALNWDKAVIFGNLYGVSADSIMNGATSIFTSSHDALLNQLLKIEQTAIADYTLEDETNDSLFIRLLLSMGHSITFKIIILNDNSDKIKRTVHFRQIKNFSSTEAYCKFKDGDKLVDAVIDKVLFNNVVLTHSEFSLITYHLYTYIESIFNGINNFKTMLNHFKELDIEYANRIDNMYISKSNINN